MQTADHILQAMRRMGERRLPLTRVYHSLYSEDLFLAAYGKLYRNTGALTPGTDNDTVDGMSRRRIRKIIEALRYERFRFRPARRIHIPKKNGGSRPLGIPNFSDKLVQEVLRMLLQAYYEPRFRDSAHGFRPGRGCHTALTTIQHKFRGSAWFIEGDIKGCFDHINHDILLDILSRDIHDGRLRNLLRMSLKAGVMEDWQYHQTFSGTPQGGVLSPLLANIYLHELDTFIEDMLIPQYTCGTKRAPNPAYQRLDSAIRRARQRGDQAAVVEFERQRRQIPSQDTHDPDYRRLTYVRYADDFILGFIGPKAEAETIKTAIGAYLHDQLGLEMSQNKTLITHARSQQARFLGYAISLYQANHKLTRRRCQSNARHRMRSVNGHIRLGIPHGLVKELIKPYQHKGKAAVETRLLPNSDAHIIDTYQRRFRGIAEYYKYAADRHSLSELEFVMELALTRTLADKFRCTVSQVYRKYKGTRIANEHAYKTLQVEVPTATGTRIVYWGANSLKVIQPGTEALQDRRPSDRRYERADLVQRLRANQCELCGSREACEVHHIRKLSDLKDRWRGRREKPAWVERMIGLQRKTLVVCHPCHIAIHAGAPTPTRRKG